MSPNNPDSTSSSSSNIAAVPDGFVVVTLQDGSQCIVPEFLVPATHDAFDGYRTYLAKDIRKITGGVSVTLPGAGMCRAESGLAAEAGLGAGVPYQPPEPCDAQCSLTVSFYSQSISAVIRS